jgi:hypothetical protein
MTRFPGAAAAVTAVAAAAGALFAGACGRQAPPVPGRAEAAAAAPAAETGIFVDVTAQAGLRFPLGHGGRSPLTILETLGHGCALFDFDGDGRLDILLAGPGKIALYHNRGDVTFADVTAGSGLRAKGVWQGVATGDYDNDGRTDLYVSGYRDGALYHNEGGGKFREVTREAGVATKLWGASAAFVDVDNDGLLDLYVANYVKYYPDSVQFCLFNGVQSTCGPTNYDPEKGRLYRNRGNGTFADETEKRGLSSAHGNALGVAIADYDGDGWVDLAVANDQLPGDLFRNKGKGFFENVGLLSGTAYDVDGNAHAGMGIDWADFKANGSLALVVTTYQFQPTSLYEQTGPGQFADVCYTAGIGQATKPYVGFGAKFLDYDNDGLPDLAVANGHAVDNIARVDKTTTYPQTPQLFRNAGGGRLEEVTAAAGPAFRRPIVGRSLATGDVDNDGRVDLLILDIEGGPLLLRNQSPAPNHWLSLRLGGTRSNRDGIGAHLTVTANGRTWRQVVTSTGSFMAASDVRAHLGLGAARTADRVEIRWPSGRVTVLEDVEGGRMLTVAEEEKGAGKRPARKAGP